MTQGEYAKVAAEEMAATLRSVADRIESYPLLAISQMAEELEMVALRTGERMLAAQTLGAQITFGEKYLAEVSE